ncbi:MAG: DUF547 domain-containing protein [Chloroflexi bacterium]|nr:DUF547 domain-containing protein [Chloroflexota bacterium]
MTLIDNLIAGRERLLNTLLGVRAEEVLNRAPSPEGSPSGEALSAELKRAVNAFKAEAMDAPGRHVNYSLLRESDAYAMYRTACTPQLRNLDLTTLTTREERLAFWINLYNALVIDAVIAFDVQESVTEERFGLFRFFRRAAYEVGGHRFSCEDIEQGILRSNRGNPYVPGPHFASTDPRAAWVMPQPDPRIHFALNCASRSCPPVGVYDAERIHDQLDLAAQNFVDADVEVDEDAGVVRLSSIFHWYAGDFGGQPGLHSLLLRYLPEDGERHRWIAAQGDRIEFAHRAYDWTLNT